MKKTAIKGVKKYRNYKMGIIFLLVFCVLHWLHCGNCFFPEVLNIVYPVSVTAIPLLNTVFAFYKWVFGYLNAYRQMNPLRYIKKTGYILRANVTIKFPERLLWLMLFLHMFCFPGGSFCNGNN